MMYETLTEACRAFVSEMYHIPMSVVEKIANANCDDLTEVTPEDPNETYYSYFPMWGTMFAFSIDIDNHWLENHLQEMADIGFRIYQSEDYEYIFGIDGAGYDFYEAHWIPLYKAMGFKWHKIDDTVKEKA